jgi:hypothetical protein
MFHCHDTPDQKTVSLLTLDIHGVVNVGSFFMLVLNETSWNKVLSHTVR